MTWRRLGALFLALLFTTVWSVNSLHDFFLHHEHPVCEAAFDGKSTHIHDERYEGNSCNFCAFVLSAPELLSILALPARPGKLPETVTPAYYRQPNLTRSACDSTLRRGPPVI